MGERAILLSLDGAGGDHRDEHNDIAPETCALPMQKICYGLGHVYNDLCAAVWFSYTLFYFQIVLRMEPTTAGALIMIGQIADALATPTAGWAVDTLSTPRAWHLTGTLLVAVGFTTMFSYAPSTSTTAWVSHLYYGHLVIAFQIGWAIVQISHLSIITTIARDNHHSAKLTSIRYTASVCCNVFVYLITWAILRNGSSPSPAMTQLGPADFVKFKEIILIITCVGIVSSLIFYCGMGRPTAAAPEQQQPHHRIVEEAGDADASRKRKNFLTSLVTYQVSIMYMSSRLYTILNLIYMPLYLEERLGNGGGNGDSSPTEVTSIRGAIASVPLMCFIASFLTAILINHRPAFLGDKLIFALGSCISLIGCIWMALSNPQDTNSENYDVYGMAAIIGTGSSGTMITSLCLTAAFVHTNGFKGGSVYSTVTFTDKLISGAVVLLIQHMECADKSLCPNFYQNVLAYASGACIIMGMFALGCLQCHNPLLTH